MNWMKKGLVVTVTAGLVAGLAVSPAQAKTVDARDLLKMIPVAAESHEGSYDRDDYKHWVDADGDSCDTREEVLIAESKVRATVGSGCRVSKGKWVSKYDGATWTKPADVDIDHVVALAEAHRSGAYGWSAAKRQRYANDLGYGGTLVAVTDNVNQSKGDKDPSEWLPAKGKCSYAITYTKVKYRWRLKMDPAERKALSKVMSGSCGARDVKLPARAA